MWVANTDAVCNSFRCQVSGARCQEDTEGTEHGKQITEDNIQTVSCPQSYVCWHPTPETYFGWHPCRAWHPLYTSSDD